jgi:hypothetical protein
LSWREDRVLTALSQTRSRWKLFDWMPNTSISHHHASSIKDGYFQSASIGQEFVIDANNDVIKWAESILRDS